jgi:acyl-CoA synthetase (AMP-forming)/AMP-acid ligase II
MIDQLLQAASRAYPDRLFLVSSARQLSFGDCRRECLGVATALQALEPDRLACRMTDSVDLALLLLGAALVGKAILPLDEAMDEGEAQTLCSSLGIGEILRSCPAPAAGPAPTGEGSLWLMTSGTAGPPKRVSYSWKDLAAQVPKASDTPPGRWLLAYRLSHFAGVQMLVHTLVNGATLVIPDSAQVGDAVRAAARFGVTHLSASPTFWRFALAAREVAALPLQQVTLGSEAVSADILAALTATFPGARIVHVYATTELGSLVAVSDRLPGLPTSVLDRPADAAVRLRVVDGELEVLSRHGARGKSAGWIPTGDLVREADGRLLFAGRRSEVVNVGGLKVNPQEVEEVLGATDGVLVLRAYGQENPITGQALAVDVVPMQGVDTDDLEERLRDAATALPRPARPVRINLVSELPLKNLKLQRR